MCYKFPGPRCSNHAFKALTKAKSNWENASTAAERHKAIAALRAAEDNYDATIKGQQDLAKRIEETGDPEGRLSARLEYAVYRRKRMLASIQTKDVGDVEESHRDEDEVRPQQLRLVDPHAPQPVAVIPQQRTIRDRHIGIDEKVDMILQNAQEKDLIESFTSDEEDLDIFDEDLFDEDIDLDEFLEKTTQKDKE